MGYDWVSIQDTLDVHTFTAVLLEVDIKLEVWGIRMDSENRHLLIFRILGLLERSCPEIWRIRM